MANPNDVKRALAGDKNLQRADLTGANLRNKDLSDVDFRKADLRKADLSKSTLSRADLRDAKLTGAKIRGCKFYGNYEELGYWNLNGVDLQGSHFKNIFVELGKANSKTIFNNCTFESTVLFETGGKKVQANNLPTLCSLTQVVLIFAICRWKSSTSNYKKTSPRTLSLRLCRAAVFSVKPTFLSHFPRLCRVAVILIQTNVSLSRRCRKAGAKQCGSH